MVYHIILADILLIARIFPRPCGAWKNTTQLAKYPRVLYDKPSKKMYVLPSHFCGLWLVLILKLNDVRKQIPAAFKWLYKNFTLSSMVFIENSTFTVIIKLLHHWETPVQMICLNNTSNCSYSVLFRPLFSLEAAITKWLFGLHSCVIFNTFRFQSTHFMITKTIKLAGNFKLSATKLFTCKIIYVQVERIVILIKPEFISLQFCLSL